MSGKKIALFSISALFLSFSLTLCLGNSAAFAENLLGSGDPFTTNQMQPAAAQPGPAQPAYRPHPQPVPVSPAAVAQPQPIRGALSPYTTNMQDSKQAPRREVNGVPGSYGKSIAPAQQPPAPQPVAAPAAPQQPAAPLRPAPQAIDNGSQNYYNKPHVENRICRVGIFVDGGFEETMKFWEPTVKHLNRQLPGVKFEPFSLQTSVQGFAKSSKTKDVDFLIVDPAGLVICNTEFGGSVLATLVDSADKRDKNGSISTQLAGVIFCRVDDNSIKSAADVSGKTIVALNEISYAGQFLQADALKASGVDIYDKKQLILYGKTTQKTIEAVLTKKADVGFVSIWALERAIRNGEVKENSIRILNYESKVFENARLPLSPSTKPGPNWAFIKTPDCPQDLAKQVTLALLQYTPPAQPTDGENDVQRFMGWAVPQNYSSVLKTMRSLFGPSLVPGGSTSVWDHPEQAKHTAMWIGLLAGLLIAAAIFLFIRTRIAYQQLQESEDNLGDTQSQLEEIRADHNRTETILAQNGIRLDMIGQDQKMLYANSSTTEQHGPYQGVTCKEYYAKEGDHCSDCPIGATFTEELNVAQQKKCKALGDFQTVVYENVGGDRVCSRVLLGDRKPEPPSADYD